ncbi:hypothetical protein [Nocardioides antri]|uniref:Uncharacterized protein n=1 Tax=Nocardioides antri TaxID=2607659 RepID=A0A5B1LUH0_9ACTN|nr:hypothetical protein [Nocardioides antri]KAA1424322.1 hypothetical protein F0U47_18995 [Nocardioides antri]
MRIHELISGTGDHVIEVTEYGDELADDVAQEVWTVKVYRHHNGNVAHIAWNLWSGMTRTAAMERLAEYLDYLDGDVDETH